MKTFARALILVVSLDGLLALVAAPAFAWATGQPATGSVGKQDFTVDLSDFQTKAELT